MSYQRIKAGVNLYAILKNLEDLIALDSSCKEMIANKKISVQFVVKNGPKAWLKFENDSCVVGQGRMKNPSLKLWFTSPEHLNKMFDGKANPIPLKGFTKLGFLQKEFTEITKKLEYYLKPELIENPDDEYIKINTQFTLTVAAFALPEIAKYEKRSKITASHMQDGNIQLSVLPDGPHVYIKIKEGNLSTIKGKVEKPDAIMEMKDFKTGNDFLNGKSNPFKAIASGEVIIKGQTPLLDNLSLILDKVMNYTS
jgi:putative sterol carrier protein